VALHVDERFAVDAPPRAVWAFMVDPRRVVACVPGGELGPILDGRSYDGRVRVRVGPLTLAYGGRVTLAEVDERALRVKIVGVARETAGTDSARMTLVSGLAALPSGATEVVANVRVDVEGRIAALGRPVLERVGHEVFRAFAARVREVIEAEVAGRAPPPPRGDALRPFPLLLAALRAWLAERIGARGAPAP
jgi:carbon monoxide dehydrogenase subunit G